MKMNLDKWTQRALKKVEKMSARQKIAMIDALDIVLSRDTGQELIHLDIKGETMDEIAEAYGIDLCLDDEDMEDDYEVYEYTPNPELVLQVFNGEYWVNVEKEEVE